MSGSRKQLKSNRALSADLCSHRRCGGRAPAEPRRDVLEDCLDDVGVVIDPKLVGQGQQQLVGFHNRSLFDWHIKTK